MVATRLSSDKLMKNPRIVIAKENVRQRWRWHLEFVHKIGNAPEEIIMARQCELSRWAQDTDDTQPDPMLWERIILSIDLECLAYEAALGKILQDQIEGRPLIGIGDLIHVLQNDPIRQFQPDETKDSTHGIC